MIVRLDKQKQRTARHQLLNDVVYVISHEALKQMQREGHTDLSPVEVFLSARNFCDAILQLPDIEEGLDDEMDDLEDEMEGKDDYMLILTLATVQLQAMSKRRVGIDFRKIIFRIFERLDGYEHLLPLIEQMTDKEDQRWLAGKKTNLLDYELQEIKLEGGGTEEVKNLHCSGTRGLILSVTEIPIIVRVFPVRYISAFLLRDVLAPVPVKRSDIILCSRFKIEEQPPEIRSDSLFWCTSQSPPL